jgi:ACR3 family arsenite efflux pump ArsB
MLSRRFGVAWCVAAPAALIGASNCFELAVAAAISPALTSFITLYARASFS